MLYNFVGFAALLIVTGRTSSSPVPDHVDEFLDVSVANQTSTLPTPQVIPASLQQEQVANGTDVDEARNCTLKALSIVLSTSGGSVGDKCREVLKLMMTNAGKREQEKEMDPIVDLKRELNDLAKAEETYGIADSEELLAEKRASKMGEAVKVGEAVVDGAGLEKGTSEYDYPDGSEDFSDSNFLVNSAGIGLLEDMKGAKGPDSDFLVIPLSFLRKQFMLQEAEETKGGKEVSTDSTDVASENIAKDTGTNTLASWLLRALFMMDAMSSASKVTAPDIPKEEAEKADSQGEVDNSSSEKKEKESKKEDGKEDKEEKQKGKKEEEKESDDTDEEAKEDDGEEEKNPSEFPGFDLAALERLEAQKGVSQGKGKKELVNGEDDSSSEKEEKISEKEAGEKDEKEEEKESDDKDKEAEEKDGEEQKTSSEFPGFDPAALERLESDISLLGKDLAMLQLQSDS